ncbi:MAG TPA: YceI family protein [Mucilaginibacter sp.]
MKKFLFPALLIFVVASAFTLAGSTVTRSAITFKIKNIGISTGGSFGGLQADVKFNPADLAGSSIQASVETATINTDNNSRDEHLRSEDFFDVAKYPKITLKSTSFKHRSGDNYTGKFDLTMKNKTQSVDIPFTAAQSNGATTFKGSFKINRRDFGVGSNSFTLSDEVIVSIDTEIK